MSLGACYPWDLRRRKASVLVNKLCREKTEIQDTTERRSVDGFLEK